MNGCRRYALSSFIPSSNRIGEATFKSVAHTCWFCVPEQQMKQYEILARGSGCIVRGKQDNLLWALVSAHVAAPFLFRSYFPQEWLSMVNEQHCKHTLYGENNDQPKIIETGNIIWKHELLDVAAFGLQRHNVSDEKEWEWLTSQAVELEPLSEWSGKQSVVVQGWQVKGSVGSGQEKLVACSLNGTIQVQQGIRYFINTQPHIAYHGMCGGPILLPQSIIIIIIIILA
ncbi:uncharacterized protein Gasu_46270 [Galdieria sulphuraria]|uniref:Uncharacterized protein n=1 Tax=Galdieria sulphuraria TaxID=130081 RepID=M2XCX0_GALSU|nr:uncharacterized protein Gasu_46270 [Galdieria sulphuraria]EME27802.1 hypothetical protein Gasu_46270 [Galdieria sulphuraria]|eukprot:XP_005704322.1 hypothetical protein Gasu_46270 [Galdieria sulphuraria]